MFASTIINIVMKSHITISTVIILNRIHAQAINSFTVGVFDCTAHMYVLFPCFGLLILSTHSDNVMAQQHITKHYRCMGSM